jgi:hypothetical protein
VLKRPLAAGEPACEKRWDSRRLGQAGFCDRNVLHFTPRGRCAIPEELNGVPRRSRLRYDVSAPEGEWHKSKFPARDQITVFPEILLLPSLALSQGGVNFEAYLSALLGIAAARLFTECRCVGKISTQKIKLNRFGEPFKQ